MLPIKTFVEIKRDSNATVLPKNPRNSLKLLDILHSGSDDAEYRLEEAILDGESELLKTQIFCKPANRMILWDCDLVIENSCLNIDRSLYDNDRLMLLSIWENSKTSL
jgi:hypothetical protein